MIEDKELREIFKAESEEHLSNLDKGLLHMEKHPGDIEALKELFREAHSLKGASRMLDLSSIEIIAHRFEDMLGSASRGQSSISQPMIDKMYRALDSLRRLVHESVTGEMVDVDVSAVLDELDNKNVAAQAPPPPKEVIKQQVVQSQEVSEPVQQKPEQTVVEPEVHEKAAEKEPVKPESKSEKAASASTAPKSGQDALRPASIRKGSYHIDTIRIETSRLDSLMTQDGELAVAVKRMLRLGNEIDVLAKLGEQWLKDFNNILSVYKSLEKRYSDTQFSKVFDYFDRQQQYLDKFETGVKQFSISMDENNARLSSISGKLHNDIRKARLLPLSTIFNQFHRMVRDLAKDRDKEISLTIEGGETTADKQILEEMKDPLMHIIRNAVDHGIEAANERQRIGKPQEGNIRLKARQSANSIVIEVADDGAGLDTDKIRQKALKAKLYHKDELDDMSNEQIQSLIFSSGLSTSDIVTDISGRGIGLDVVRNNVERLKGQITVSSEKGNGCSISIQLPITLSTTRVFLVSISRMIFAIPVEYVLFARNISHNEIFHIEGKETIKIDGKPVSVALLSDLLRLPVKTLSETESITQRNTLAKLHNRPAVSKAPCIILSAGEERLGVLVDALLDEQEIMQKPHSSLLKRVRNVSGATILGTGEVCMVLNPLDLIKTVKKIEQTKKTVDLQGRPDAVSILLVEDSITTRIQEKRILEAAGFDVVTAVNGVDGFNKLSGQTFSAVVSDIQMPYMDGFTFTEKIRSDKRYSDLPIILVTSLTSEEDKRKGIEVGANAYITKPTFEQKTFIDTLRRLL